MKLCAEMNESQLSGRLLVAPSGYPVADPWVGEKSRDQPDENKGNTAVRDGPASKVVAKPRQISRPGSNGRSRVHGTRGICGASTEPGGFSDGSQPWGPFIVIFEPASTLAQISRCTALF